jgi:hypothetical protein
MPSAKAMFLLDVMAFGQHNGIDPATTLGEKQHSANQQFDLRRVRMGAVGVYHSATGGNMKRFARLVSAVVLALAFAAGPALAQGLRVGAKFGIDFADLGGDVEDTKIKTGFSAGAFFGADLGTMFRLGVDGQYVQKGAKGDDVDIDELEIKLDYIEFMVPISVVVPTQGSVAPRFFAGPAIAFETSCKLAATVDGIGRSIDCDQEDIGLATKSVDIGLVFGLGADVALGTGAFVFDLLYNFGLSNINDAAGSDESLKNKNIQLTIGYAYLFGGS